MDSNAEYFILVLLTFRTTQWGGTVISIMQMSIYDDGVKDLLQAMQLVGSRGDICARAAVDSCAGWQRLFLTGTNVPYGLAVAQCEPRPS